jgi:hypothetical protein
MDMDKEGFEDDFRRLRLGNRVHGVQKLSPRTPLGKAFTDVPNDGHLHIVVQNGKFKRLVATTFLCLPSRSIASSFCNLLYPALSFTL